MSFAKQECIRCLKRYSETGFDLCKKCFSKENKIPKKKPKLITRSFILKGRRALRKEVFSVYPKQCMCCGSTKRVMHIDHIKPTSKFKNLEYDLMNVQVLCINCNMKKSNKNENDYRSNRQIESMKEKIKTLSYSNIVVRRYLSDNKIPLKKIIKRIDDKSKKTKVILRKKQSEKTQLEN